MTNYEELLRNAKDEGIKVIELNLGTNKKCGKYISNMIFINSVMLQTEKNEVLAEELGHHFFTIGNITDQTNINNKKQELFARRWGYDKLIGLDGLVSAYKEHIQGTYNLSEYFNVSVDYFKKSVDYYKQKYGLFYKYNEKYTLTFEPLGMLVTWEVI